MIKVITLGGANLDTHIKSHSIIHNEDSNPASVSFSAGGVVRNIAENLSLLGIKPVFLGAIGSDSNGNYLMKYSTDAGIDMSHVYISTKYPTSCYLDFLQPDGEMYVAANDMNIVNDISADYIQSKEQLFKEADILLIDANMPENIIKQAVRISKNCKVFADGTSAIKAVRLFDILPDIFLLKLNKEELSALSGIIINDNNDIVSASGILLEKGLHSLCVSLGKDGCYYADREGITFFKALTPLKDVQNVTGCGDSMMAGLVYGYIEYSDKLKMILTGLACGKITAASTSSINRNLNKELIERELGNEL